MPEIHTPRAQNSAGISLPSDPVSTPSPNRRHSLIAAGLCVVAALRVLTFLLAFPFFAPTDEQLHFDAIIQYGHSYVPHNPLPNVIPETARLIDLYQSTEFLAQTPPFAVRHDGWCAPAMDVAPGPGIVTGYWVQHPNEEINQSRPYYRMVAWWYGLGRSLGYSGILALYWARSLNALFYGLTVWFGYLFARRCYGPQSFVPLALCFVLLVFPQDIFYVLNPNAWFPVFFTVSLYLLAVIATDAAPSYWMYAVAGLLCALTFLLGFGNFSIFFPFLYVAIANSKAAAPRARRAITLLLLAAAVPLAFWVIRNRVLLGDWTGTASKLSDLGWTTKPLSQVLHHPIFFAHGFWYFTSTLSRNFWRGEITWHGTPRVSWIDGLYLFSTGVFAAAFLWHVFRQEDRPLAERFADRCSLAIVCFSVFFLICLSLRYDFGTTYYPSRALPYFVSGRLIIGALVPFLVIYLRGLELLWKRALPRVSPLLPVLALVVCIAITESLALRPVFASPYNFYGAVARRGCNLPSFADQLRDTNTRH